ncbi:MAG: hypothetical protein LQ339_006369 [Xanthoria mediterranea]|nr:MAG: hypothetical protein LQ339_006369 [Xanthoria mediterranea]
MKSFVVSAIAGAVIIGMHGVAAILGVEAAAIPTMDAGSLIERQDKFTHGTCWETSTGEVRCPARKEKREDTTADGTCWETSTGEVRCPVTYCWETSTGEVRCPARKDKRDCSNANGE